MLSIELHAQDASLLWQSQQCVNAMPMLHLTARIDRLTASSRYQLSPVDVASPQQGLASHLAMQQ